MEKLDSRFGSETAANGENNSNKTKSNLTACRGEADKVCEV